MIAGIEEYFIDIVVQRSNPGSDTWGNPVQVWSDHLIIKGRMRKLNGREQYAAKKDTEFASYRLYCRPANIQKNDRIVLNDKNYEVKAVNNVMEMDELMQVECELA